MSSSSIAHLTAESFDDAIQAGGAILLDCWADWCAPCRALSPLLAKLADEYAGALCVAKLNVEEHQDLSRRLAVRNLPTLVLFRDGQELARRSGLLTLPQLHEWLARFCVKATVAVGAGGDATGPLSPDGAFYGDAELKAFLVGRLQRHAAAGEVTVSRFPYWHEGKGTVTGALVHNQRGQVFERVSGLPLSLGCAMHFVEVTSETAVKQVFDAIRPGSNLDGVAPALFAAWLGDETLGWPTLLEHEPALLALREQWLHLFRAECGGDSVAPTQWHALRRQATDLDDKSDPRKAILYAFASMIAQLSPLPSPDDEAAWGSVFMMQGGQLMFAILQSAQGWSGEDIAMDAMRFHWFKQRAKPDAEGNLDEEQLRQLRAQWEGEHADWMRLNKAFFSQCDAQREPYSARLRAKLAELLSAAPMV